ncbi:hypothetical protein V6N11_080373 [Hibiscus sabdariffa]|uniref:Uncharacterized protein n=1 Tax=Hibiscus sabdariffa TaxID=183260 RepID=A0ABR2R7H2_9ROSI
MNRGNQPADGQNDQPVDGNAGALARPRAIRDHLTPILDDLNPGIVAPEIQAAYFELKPVMFNMLNSIGQFGGSPHEDARQHIRAFLEVVMFYNGVNAPTRMMLDASANGTLLDKSPEEAFDILDRIANNDYQFPTARLGAGRRASGKLDLDANDSVSAQLSAITNMLKNLQKPTNVRDAKALSCVHCKGNHHANDYPTMHESASYVGNYNRNANNPYSNTYNLGWRQHPNFSWGNQGGGNTSNANRQQNMNASPGFQTTMPWQSKAKGNASTSHKNSMERSGTTINKNVEFRGEENTEASPVSKQKESEVQEEAQEEEGREEVLTTNPSRGQSADAAAKSVPTQATEEVRPPPPFPQRLKKHKADNQFKKFVDMIDQLHIDVPFLEAIDQMPTYAKFLKDIITKKRKIESFIIPCSIGDNYVGKALCALGSSVNLMPKSFFMKLGMGIARPTTVILQLVDRSHVRPEGKVEDLLVKVGKFVFRADFLILDCEVDHKAPIILGQPFLATRIIFIDCEKGGFTMRVGDQTMTINVYNTIRYMDNGEECHSLQDLIVTATADDTELCYSSSIQIEDFMHLQEEDQEEVDDLPFQEKQIKPFIPRSCMKFESLDFTEFVPPKPSLEIAQSLELKPLPFHLKYVYLGANDTLPVIISSQLNADQELSVFNLLKQYKKAIG